MIFVWQVFDVVLNGDLTIASDLDVYERVGRGVAHDEYIEFEVKSGKILYNQDETEITRGKMRVEFIKTYRDNPKVNAIILVKGKLSGKIGTKSLIAARIFFRNRIKETESLVNDIH